MSSTVSARGLSIDNIIAQTTTSKVCSGLVRMGFSMDESHIQGCDMKLIHLREGSETRVCIMYVKKWYVENNVKKKNKK